MDFSSQRLVVKATAAADAAAEAEPEAETALLADSQSFGDCFATETLSVSFLFLSDGARH